MKIEYLSDGSEDCPLVRLFSFEAAEVAELRAACRALHDGSADRYRLGSIQSLESIGECELTLEAGARDRGLVLRATWDNVERPLEPFEERDATGYQWLDSIGDASLVISRNGSS